MYSLLKETDIKIKYNDGYNGENRVNILDVSVSVFLDKIDI